jgi:hypothetical protein
VQLGNPGGRRPVGVAGACGLPRPGGPFRRGGRWRVACQPVDRPIADERVDSGLLVEGKELAGGQVTFDGHAGPGSAQRGGGAGNNACCAAGFEEPAGRRSAERLRLAYGLLKKANIFELV